MYDQVIAGTTNIDKVSKVVVSLSGGLDSTTLLYLMVKKLGRDNVAALSFNYNQRHSIELTQAKRTARKLGIYHKIIDISFLGDITSGVSAMVKGDIKTPTIQEVEDQKNVSTYVPFRNTILTAITFAFAESFGADGIALGVQYGDYAMKDGNGSNIYHYWDTSNLFHEAMQAVADLNDKHHITFIAPFVNLTKSTEIKLGQELGVEYGDTWTCYAGKSDKEEQLAVNESAGGRNYIIRKHYQPCGECPSCVGRIEAFKENGITDPVVAFGVWDD
jgi:7-cyano-7-deazaguanine synthase